MEAAKRNSDNQNSNIQNINTAPSFKKPAEEEVSISADDRVNAIVLLGKILSGTAPVGDDILKDDNKSFHTIVDEDAKSFSKIDDTLVQKINDTSRTPEQQEKDMENWFRVQNMRMECDEKNRKYSAEQREKDRKFELTKVITIVISALGVAAGGFAAFAAIEKCSDSK